jgi:hypothetical protein
MGGRGFDLTPEEVRLKMKGVVPDPIQVWTVEIDDTVFPPKQVIEVCLGFPRTTFITDEAVRVLNRLGFNCQRTDRNRGKEALMALFADEGDQGESSPLAQGDIESLRASLTTVQILVASLHERVTALEEGRA